MNLLGTSIDKAKVTNTGQRKKMYHLPQSANCPAIKHKAQMSNISHVQIPSILGIFSTRNSVPRSKIQKKFAVFQFFLEVVVPGVQERWRRECVSKNRGQGGNISSFRNFESLGSLNNASVQFSSVSQSCQTLCNPMDCSMPGTPAPHYLPEFAQVHIHCIGDAIQSSHSLMSSSPPALNLSQHHRLS